MATTTTKSKPERLFQRWWAYGLLGLLMGYHMAVAASFCWNRLSTPVLIDGSEDVFARFAYHMANGQDVYGPITVDIERLAYTPLAFQINALAVRLFGLDVRFQRAVALLFSLGCLIVLGACLRRLTGSLFLAAFGAALFLGIDVSIWYIVMGPNSPHVFFSLLGVFLLIRKDPPDWRTALLATLSFFASFWCKQTGLAYLVAGVAYVACRDFRKGIAAALFAGLLVAVGEGYYALKPNSQFMYNCFEWFQYDRVIWSRLLNPILFPDVLGRFGVLSALLLAGVFAIKPSFKNYVQPHYLLLGAAAFAGPFASMKYGSGNNQSLFFYAMIILCGLTFLHRLLEEKHLSEHLAVFLLLVQGAALIHSDAVYYITDEDRQRFDKIQGLLAQPGKTGYYYAQGYQNVLAGKPPFVNLSRDPGAERTYGRVMYPPVITEFWQRNPFDLIISYYPWEDNAALMLQQVQQYYTLAEDIPPSTKYPQTTELRRRILVFERNKDAPAPAAQPPMRWQPPK